MAGITQWKCAVCGHLWLPRSVRAPSKCPRCQSSKDFGPAQVQTAKEMLASATEDEARYLAAIIEILRTDRVTAEGIKRTVDRFLHEKKIAEREKREKRAVK